MTSLIEFTNGRRLHELDECSVLCSVGFLPTTVDNKRVSFAEFSSNNAQDEKKPQMPSVKDESEGEGEEMSHDSNDSNQSSASCDSSAEHSDSDDSSEMDEDECERRRTECMENLVDLERQFTLLKEQLYRERITQVDTKLGEVRVGKSEEYLIPLERLKENMKTKTEVAGILKQLRLQNIHNKFLAEEQAAQQNFESEKGLVWDGIHSDLQEKIRRLEEDRNNVDIHADLWFSSSGRRRRNHTERRRAVSVAGPYIVYMLNDADILEDWALIKKSLSSRKAEIL